VEEFLAQKTEPGTAASIYEPNDGVMSKSTSYPRFDLLPPIVQLSPGRHKYVVIRVQPNHCDDIDGKDNDNGNGNVETLWFVRSASPSECGGPVYSYYC
jgi:hypothetical protein